MTLTTRYPTLRQGHVYTFEIHGNSLVFNVTALHVVEESSKNLKEATAPELAVWIRGEGKNLEEIANIIEVCGISGALFEVCEHHSDLTDYGFSVGAAKRLIARLACARAHKFPTSEMRSAGNEFARVIQKST